MFNWYALHTRSKYEQRVAQELVLRGVRPYLPTFIEVHQWKDRTKTVEVPVFPGYLFAQFEPTNSSRLNVLKADGVVRILGSGDQPTPIPEDEILALQTMLRRARGRCCAHPLLREGAHVRVKRGPLKNMEGLLTRISNQTRFVVSITLMSRSVSAEVDARDVELVFKAVAA